ncbi:MAG: hypothetical protein HOP12_03995 [Candidatus Eisenbacteria bacterium]|uniref:Flagellar protein FlgN n=1 Tax=Eiseniibacteriota bacterium TaxID=2212470 RepID=A0A849SL58_UNCEI|nr:hypothetical protein [Candidatus Eisenbacteria bacterium]
MNMPPAPPPFEPAPRPAVATPLARLVAALERESTALRELAATLGRQRTHLSRDATDELEAESQNATRVLSALEEARRHRADCVRGMGADPEDSKALTRTAAADSSGRVAAACALLRKASADAAREAAINKKVIAAAQEAHHSFIATLFSADTPSVYPASPEPHEALVRQGALFDRRA